TPIKVQLGPLMNGLVIMESFIPAPTLDFPGLKAMLEKYQAKAPSLGIDPLGYGFTPFAYAAGQVLAQAVEATKSLDHDKLADYVHAHKFSTVAGEIAFGKDGEWTKSRQLSLSRRKEEIGPNFGWSRYGRSVRDGERAPPGPRSWVRGTVSRV